MSQYPNATFIKSANAPSQFVADDGAEVAFAGRSNAGKSSAINALTGQKALARTSKTPGRTQQIVVFEIDAERRIDGLLDGRVLDDRAAREHGLKALFGLEFISVLDEEMRAGITVNAIAPGRIDTPMIQIAKVRPKITPRTRQNAVITAPLGRISPFWGGIAAESPSGISREAREG